jgi:SAM-dependent methyltransferase
MTGTQREFWEHYYQDVYAAENTWLDYSNDRVQVQTFGIAIEAAGPVAGRRCLDVGCGRGQFSLCLSALQASEVVAIDIFTENIHTLRDRHANVRWEVGSPEDPAFCRVLGEFDIIFLLEVIQCVGLDRALPNMWRQLRPGGRIVAVVPNKDNSIVQKTVSRFEGTFLPPSPVDIAAAVASLPDVECWACRGMDFQQDQRLVPYAVSPWTAKDDWEHAPNRLAFVIQKQSRPTDVTAS